ncbi:MAG TPA: carbamoyltransferase C-terminal domain-containing protein, partial [Vicinamibacterales bacterium]
APCVLKEEAANWFDLAPQHESPYMLMVAPVKNERRVSVHAEELATMADDPDLRKRVNVVRSQIPAVTHVDYSARVQTVDAVRNPRLAKLMGAFHRRTGCPVLVNTSFNVRGEPIVCTPEDAYRCFLGTEMDALVIDDFVIVKDDVPQALDQAARDSYLAQFELD